MKKEIKGIYLIESIEDFLNETKYYVGQSLNIFERLNQHCNSNSPGIDKAILECGVDKFSFRILEVVKYKKDLDICESKWINHFRQKYGDEHMYNIVQTSNVRIKPTSIPPTIKKQIKDLFNEDLGRSIYAIAECFNVSYEYVIRIRKPLLAKNGLKWKNGKIIDMKTGMEPENWRGYQFTKKVANKIEEDLKCPQKTAKDIRYVSNSDLTIYLKTKETYEYSPSIELK